MRIAHAIRQGAPRASRGTRRHSSACRFQGKGVLPQLLRQWWLPGALPIAADRAQAPLVAENNDHNITNRDLASRSDALT